MHVSFFSGICFSPCFQGYIAVLSLWISLICSHSVTYIHNTFLYLYINWPFLYCIAVGQHFMVIIATIGSYSLVMLLSYIYLNATAASIIIVTLLPLATVPILIRSSVSIKVSDEAEISNEQSNHVCMAIYVHR